MMNLAKKLHRGPADHVSLLAAGQAGFFLVNKAGKVLALDLCLSDAVEKIEGHVGFKRLYPAPIEAGEVQADVVIATHPHYDHFDPETIPELMKYPEAHLFASPDCRPLVLSGGVDEERTTYVKPGDTYDAAGFHLHFINCDHGTGAPDAVGVLIEADGKRFLVVGDSCLRLDRKEEYLSDGEIDVMLAPINGAFGNLDAADCCRLTKALAPKLTVPSHFGLFVSHGGRPDEYYRLMKEDYPAFAFLFMGVGEEYIPE